MLSDLLQPDNAVIQQVEGGREGGGSGLSGWGAEALGGQGKELIQGLLWKGGQLDWEGYLED